MALDAARLEKTRENFSDHPPSEEGVVRHAALTNGFIEVAVVIEDTCPNGKEKNTALKILEEAKFWASAAVTRNPETR